MWRVSLSCFTEINFNDSYINSQKIISIMLLFCTELSCSTSTIEISWNLYLSQIISNYVNMFYPPWCWNWVQNPDQSMSYILGSYFWKCFLDSDNFQVLHSCEIGKQQHKLLAVLARYAHCASYPRRQSNFRCFDFKSGIVHFKDEAHGLEYRRNRHKI